MFFTRPLCRVSPRFRIVAAALLTLALAAGCATRPMPDEDGDVDEPVSRGGTLGPAEGVTGTAWAEMSAPPKAGELKPDDLKWEIFRVPGKQPASYSYVRHEGRDAVLAKVEASGSILRHRYRIEPEEIGLVRFSWNVPNARTGANLTLPQLDDVPVRVVLAFEGDRSRLSMKNSLLSELSRLLTGEEMPFATLVYSWSRINRPGEVVVNDRTDRIRKIVVDSGDHGYNEWRSYERDIRADYRQAFGEDPGALLSFAVFTEGEKNEGQLQAFYGPLKLVPASAVARK
ncbi:DUF3047 domain-containing protein [Polaromonas aquatica]|uniref:DUF3047 domain-containing protein n=1 Tax=Polaromonas aquatica TaxID=332657 RepID=UPI003D6513F0